MSPGYRYLHLDVFTDQPFSGNPLAVFPDARRLDPALMQRIAAEIGFSETTFVLPAETPGTDARVRIFTPRTELPVAGHPTIGTAFALAHEGVLATGRTATVFGLGVGPTRVQLEWQDDALRFAWMTQIPPRFGLQPRQPERLARALGLDAQHLDGRLPVQEASSGLSLLFVPLRSRQAVDAVRLDLVQLREYFGYAQLPEQPFYVFSLERGDDDAVIYSRMFAPGFGIAEDPATGGAGGPLGGYLVRHAAVSVAQAAHLVCLQGVAMGRASRIHLAVEVRESVTEAVRVGGQAVLLATGTMHLPLN